MLSNPGRIASTVRPVGPQPFDHSTYGTEIALALLRHVVQPVILMDPDGRITQLNPAAQAMLATHDWPHSQGCYWSQLWPHADPDELRDALSEAVAGETVVITLDCRRSVASTAVLCPVGSGDRRIAKIVCVLRAA